MTRRWVAESRVAKVTYREARGMGWPISAAHAAAVRDAKADLVLEEFYPHRSMDTMYNVDVCRLAEATRGPVKHVVLLDGTHPDGLVTLPPMATAQVTVTRDDRGWEAEECYDPEDEAAWRDDRWAFYGVIVEVTLPFGRVGSASIWGVEVGPYWVGTNEGQVWDVIPDLIVEALGEAERLPFKREITAEQVNEAANLLAEWDRADWDESVNGIVGTKPVGTKMAALLAAVVGIDR